MISFSLFFFPSQQKVMGIYLSAQGRLLGLIRPAQWLGWLHKQNRAAVIWQLPASVTASRLQTVLEEAQEGSYQVGRRSHRNSSETTRLVSKNHRDHHYPLSSGINDNSYEEREVESLPTIYFYTGLTWLDVIDVDVDPTTNEAHLRSASSSWIPAGVPLSPLLGMLFFWVVFFDHGANLAHLNILHEKVEAGLQTRVQQRTVLAGKIMRPIEYLIVILMFIITLIATVLNYAFNDYFILNIVVTIICITLTVNTILTLTCGILLNIAARRARALETHSSWSDIES